jgi:hypothetical protein
MLKYLTDAELQDLLKVAKAAKSRKEVAADAVIIYQAVIAEMGNRVAEDMRKMGYVY